MIKSVEIPMMLIVEFQQLKEHIKNEYIKKAEMVYLLILMIIVTNLL
jgi:hypothetical protein